MPQSVLKTPAALDDSQTSTLVTQTGQGGEFLGPAPPDPATTATLKTFDPANLGFATLRGDPPPSGIGLDPAKIAGTPYAEEVDGYAEEFCIDGTQRVVRRWNVRWFGRKKWVDEMLGYAVITAPGVLSRSIPAQVPELGYEHLYCERVELVRGQGMMAKNPHVFLHRGDGQVAFNPGGAVLVAGEGVINLPGKPPAQAIPVDMICYLDGGNALREGLGLYAATYGPRPYEVRNDAEAAALAALDDTPQELERYVEREGRSAVQQVPLPKGAIVWQEGPYLNQAIVDNAAFKLLHTEELTYTWHELPALPLDAIQACVGRVNANPFDGARGARLYPAQTLLCQAPVRARYRHPRGTVFWRLRYSFLFRPQGWSSLPDADGNDRRVGFATGDKGPLYPTADFDALFKPPAPVVMQ